MGLGYLGLGNIPAAFFDVGNDKSVYRKVSDTRCVLPTMSPMISCFALFVQFDGKKSMRSVQGALMQ